MILLRMFNYEVEGLTNFLMEQKLAGKRSRMRTRFSKLLIARLEEIEKDKTELLKEYVEREENGDFAICYDEETKQTSYKITDIDSFNTEYDILMKEEFIIFENPEREEMMDVVRDVVLNCESAYSGKEAIQYDRWCEIVESE